jgi:hypothetical protein
LELESNAKEKSHHMGTVFFFFKAINAIHKKRERIDMLTAFNLQSYN